MKENAQEEEKPAADVAKETPVKAESAAPAISSAPKDDAPASPAKEEPVVEDVKAEVAVAQESAPESTVEETAAAQEVREHVESLPNNRNLSSDLLAPKVVSYYSLEYCS